MNQSPNHYARVVPQRTDTPRTPPAQAKSIPLRRFAKAHNLRSLMWMRQDVLEDDNGVFWFVQRVPDMQAISIRKSLPESAIPENPKAIESESPTQLSAACIEPADNFDADEVETPHGDDGFVDESLPFMGKTLGEEGKL